MAASAILFALFYLLQIWEVDGRSELLISIGILAGFSYAVKYTAAIAVPYALGYVMWKAWRGLVSGQTRAGHSCASRDLHPALDGEECPVGRQSPGAFRKPVFSESLRTRLLRTGISPQTTVLPTGEFPGCSAGTHGERRAPAGILWARLPADAARATRIETQRRTQAPARRNCVRAAVVSQRGEPLPHSRVAPALALALALEWPAGILPAIAMAHAILSWYGTPLHYYDEYAPRISSLPWRAALRIESEAYLARRSAGYLVDRMIERLVPPGESVLALDSIPEAWTTRRVLGWYYAAENEMLADILRIPLAPERGPVRLVALRFPEQPLRGVRAVQTGRPAAVWSVSEIQTFHRGRPVPADGNWRFTASPNPWDAPLAFDSKLVTRWRSWQSATPGMFIEASFPDLQRLDEVRLVTTPDAPGTQVELQGQDSRGTWRMLQGERAVSALPPTGDLRAEATAAVRARGVRYLLVSSATPGANEFEDNADAWGMRLIGTSGQTRLYFLQTARPEPNAQNSESSIEALAVPPGEYDDADPRIRLRAAWSRDTQFSETLRHSLTYSNVAGASAALVFTGKTITYLYTRAPNRGIAEVLIDGRSMGRLDLYSAQTVWQSRTKHTNTTAGRRTPPHADSCHRSTKSKSDRLLRGRGRTAGGIATPHDCKT